MYVSGGGAGRRSRAPRRVTMKYLDEARGRATSNGRAVDGNAHAQAQDELRTRTRACARELVWTPNGYAAVYRPWWRAHAERTCSFRQDDAGRRRGRLLLAHRDGQRPQALVSGAGPWARGGTMFKKI